MLPKPPNLPSPAVQDPRRIETLLAIMAALRDPETGCPWDQKQTFETIAPYSIEEAYEVAETIARGSMNDLCDELGDLLLQPVYHAQMAAEAGLFDFQDVVEAICTKMVRRHPHVFGDEAARATPPPPGFWEKNKAAEAGPEGRTGTLDGIALALPALLRARKLQARAARVGFDWPSTDQVLDKIIEEADELRTAPPDKRAEEFGDLLFVMVNLARHLDIDPEAALRGANAKFERRFAHIEAGLKGMGKTPETSDLAEMDALWDDAKAHGL